MTGDRRKARAINRMVSDLVAFAWTLDVRECERFTEALSGLASLRLKDCAREPAPMPDNVIPFPD